MSTNITPGPWSLAKVKNKTGRITRLVPVDSEKMSVLTVVDDGETYFAAVYLDSDARLIAAAPELLEALKDLLDATAIPSTVCKERAAYDKALAAIAKATGEPQ